MNLTTTIPLILLLFSVSLSAHELTEKEIDVISRDYFSETGLALVDLELLSIKKIEQGYKVSYSIEHPLETKPYEATLTLEHKVNIVSSSFKVVTSDPLNTDPLNKSKEVIGN